MTELRKSPTKSLEEKDIGLNPVDVMDSEFGGVEERKRLERKLLWKLDCRLLILMVIYILNYVSLCRRRIGHRSGLYRWIGIMQRECI